MEECLQKEKKLLFTFGAATYVSELSVSSAVCRHLTAPQNEAITPGPPEVADENPAIHRSADAGLLHCKGIANGCW